MTVSFQAGDKAHRALEIDRPSPLNLDAKEIHRGGGLRMHPPIPVPRASARFFTGAQNTNRRRDVKGGFPANPLGLGGNARRCLKRYSQRQH